LFTFCNEKCKVFSTRSRPAHNKLCAGLRFRQGFKNLYIFRCRYTNMLFSGRLSWRTSRRRDKLGFVKGELLRRGWRKFYRWNKIILVL